MSFDPQNPRNSPRSASDQPTPDQPTPARYVPPQPSPEHRSPTVLLAGAAVVALGVLAVVAILVLNGGAPAATAQPSTPASAIASTPSSTALTPAVPATTMPATTPPTGPTATAPVGVPGTPATPGIPDTGVAALMAHVPEAIRPTCTIDSDNKSDVVASAACTSPDGTIALIYSSYDTANALDAAYEDLRAVAQIDPDSGRCEDHATWPAESNYEVENEPAGRRLCTDQPGSPTIYWTDDRFIILSQATSTTGDAEALVAFWATEAGPVP